MPHGQSCELWWLPMVCTVVSVTIQGIYSTTLNGFSIFVSNMATSSEGPSWFVCQCYLVGLDKIVQVSCVRQSHQLPPDSMVVVTWHDDHRRQKVYGLYVTFGISLRIKCIVVVPHVLWPRGTFWSSGVNAPIMWLLGFPAKFHFFMPWFLNFSTPHFPFHFS